MSFNIKKIGTITLGIILTIFFVKIIMNIISADFATSVIPGWHATIYPPYSIAIALLIFIGSIILLYIAYKVISKNLY